MISNINGLHLFRNLFGFIVFLYFDICLSCFPQDMVKDKGNRLLVDSSNMKKGGNTITDLR